MTRIDLDNPPDEARPYVELYERAVKERDQSRAAHDVLYQRVQQDIIDHHDSLEVQRSLAAQRDTALARIDLLEGELRCEVVRSAGNWNEVVRVRAERDDLRDKLRIVCEQNDALGDINEAHVQRDVALARVEQLERDGADTSACSAESMEMARTATAQLAACQAELSEARSLLQQEFPGALAEAVTTMHVDELKRQLAACQAELADEQAKTFDIDGWRQTADEAVVQYETLRAELAACRAENERIRQEGSSRELHIVLDEYEAANLLWLLRMASQLGLDNGDWHHQIEGRFAARDFGLPNMSIADGITSAECALDVHSLRGELVACRTERDVYQKRWRSCHALICQLGKHHGCGGLVSVVDSGVGALQCAKCKTNDWSEDFGPFDEKLIDKIEDEKWQRETIAALHAALVEACAIGLRVVADSQVMPSTDSDRLASLRGIAGNREK